MPYPSSVAVQSGLCQTWSETPKTFKRNMAQLKVHNEDYLGSEMSFISLYNIIFCKCSFEYIPGMPQGYMLWGRCS